MKQKFILIIFLLLASRLLVFSQENIIFKETFKDDRNKWGIKDNKEFSVSIKNDKLRLEKKFLNFTNRGCLWLSHTVLGFDTQKDFDITFKARFISGGDIFNSIDFQWGNSIEDKKVSNTTKEIFQFNFLFNGEIKLNFFNKNWNYLITKDISSLLKQQDFDGSEFNNYRIKQESNFVLIYINNVEVLKQKIVPIKGNTIGIQQCLKSVWEIDELQIKQNLKSISFATVSKDDSLTHKILIHKKNLIDSDLNDLVYPNPILNDFQLAFHLRTKGLVNFSIKSLDGSIIQQHSKYFEAGNQIINFYLEGAPGVYLLEVVKPNQEVKVYKLLKL